MPSGVTTGFPLGLTQLADFPTLSWVFYTNRAGDPDPNDGVTFGYRGGDTWVMGVPGAAPGVLSVYATETGHDYIGAGFASGGGHVVYALAPGARNPIFPLESTSAGYWGWSPAIGTQRGQTAGVLAYGVPTASNDVPVTGTARYSLFGFAATRPAGSMEYPGGPLIRGTIEVNFATRTLTGEFGSGNVPGYLPFATIPQRFAIAQTNARTDAGSFTGTLQVSGAVGQGSFEGRFTGPQARELMLRWRAEFTNPATGQTQTIFGAVAGRGD